MVTAWIRVSAAGDVTDICVPDAPDGFRERIVDAAMALRYAPARHGGHAVATVVAMQDAIAGRFDRQKAFSPIGTSTDVGWLERIAGSIEGATATWKAQTRPLGQPKDIRVVAFARLGELATSESLAAQRRITDNLAARSLVTMSWPLNAKWTHAGWHVSDYVPVPLARLRTTDGGRVALIAADVLGPRQIFVARCDDDALSRCSRPKPIGPWKWFYTKVETTLQEIAPGRLQVRIVPIGSEQRATSLGPETLNIALADLERDSDADGWTDVEERTLGLDPARADSDGDGIDDARDRAPLYAPSRAAAASDDVDILQKAIFAPFGLSESRWALFARDERVLRIEVPALSAPVLFHRLLPKDARDAAPGGVFVTWNIVRKTATEAVVEISDWNPHAGGQEVFLRRIGNEWVVVARQTTWMS